MGGYAGWGDEADDVVGDVWVEVCVGGDVGGVEGGVGGSKDRHLTQSLSVVTSAWIFSSRAAARRCCNSSAV